MSYTFTISDEDLIKIREWDSNHDCELQKAGVPKTAIGGRITYSFTPTGLGDSNVVTCACGEKLDLTDYDSW